MNNSLPHRSSLFLLLLFLILLGAGTTEELRAEDIDFDYDIFLVNDTVAVWLDVLPALDQSKMEDLAAGLDLSLAFELKIERPRRLMFSKTIASARAALAISHPLTEDIYRLRLINLGLIDREFKSQLELADYLADSVVLKLTPLDSLESAPEVRLNLNITAKSHSVSILRGLGRLPADSLDTGRQNGDEFFESVFSFFLNVIGFGKTSFHIVSPLFNPEQLTSL